MYVLKRKSQFYKWFFFCNLVAYRIKEHTQQLELVELYEKKHSKMEAKTGLIGDDGNMSPCAN